MYSQGEASKKEAESLVTVLEELRDREVELKEAVADLEKTKSTLRNAFQQAVGGVVTQGGPQVIDLGVVGQGKKRIAVDLVAPQNGEPPPLPPQSTSPPKMKKPSRTFITARLQEYFSKFNVYYLHCGGRTKLTGPSIPPPSHPIHTQDCRYRDPQPRDTQAR
jgi:hypothetical protein